MNVNKINFINYSNYPLTPRKETETTGTVGLKQKQIKEFNPNSYMDYNINFGARLFRSPANFYAQPFNQNGMPTVMKNYLNEDYEDRQHIPPAQMMSIVYGDIKDAKSLEQVKEIYPDEPLFQKLQNVNYENFRTGTLGDIMLLKDEKHPLFKDGSDDLGLYLLKKIYVECKSMKEIVPDFRKDLSDYYKDVADVDYSTIKNFGISYPDRGFWNSLTATRTEFPYHRNPRKGIQSRINGNEHKERSIYDAIEKRSQRFPEEPTHKLPDHEIQRITNTIWNSGGNIEETQKQIKKRCRNKNEEKEINFVCKYLGPIMSITLDRIHASDEMRDFFNNSNIPTKSQKRKMQEYWKDHPDMKELQSIIMSDTIKLFFEAYGADGENEYFKELIEYANSIKPNREAELKRHQELQEKYEKELRISEHPEVETKEEEKILTPEEIREQEIQEYRKKHNLQEHILYGPDGKSIKVYLNIPNSIRTYLDSVFGDAMSRAFIDKYTKHFLNSKEATDLYKMSIIIKNSTQMEATPQIADYLLDNDKIFTISKKINDKFLLTYPQENMATIQSLIDSIATLPGVNSKKLAELYEISPLNISNLVNTIQDSYSGADYENIANSIINSNKDASYEKYMKPLTKREIINISNNVVAFLKNYTAKERNTFEQKNNAMGTMAMALLAQSPNKANVSRLRAALTEYASIYGGSLRVLNNPDIPQDIKDIKMEQFVTSMLTSDTDKAARLIASEPRAELYMRLIAKSN